ncbi:hypothetical protein ACFE04_016269 [Oxalis oulophora]
MANAKSNNRLLNSCLRGHVSSPSFYSACTSISANVVSGSSFAMCMVVERWSSLSTMLDKRPPKSRKSDDKTKRIGREKKFAPVSHVHKNDLSVTSVKHILRIKRFISSEEDNRSLRKIFLNFIVKKLEVFTVCSNFLNF